MPAKLCILLEDFVKSLNKISDFVDVDTKDHSRKTKKIAIILANEMDYAHDDLIYLGYGADVHDIGKVAISPVVFRQPSKLTRGQFAAVKKHPEFGHEMINFPSVPQIMLDCVLGHHEHFDGSGYPFGLKGKEIPESAMITCISDVWESINDDRPYRQKMEREVAIEFMYANSAWFDPDIFRLFMSLVEKEVL